MSACETLRVEFTDFVVAVHGGVWWDCYRDLVSNVVLVDKETGIHLAQ